MATEVIDASTFAELQETAGQYCSLRERERQRSPRHGDTGKSHARFQRHPLIRPGPRAELNPYNR